MSQIYPSSQKSKERVRGPTGLLREYPERYWDQTETMEVFLDPVSAEAVANN